MSNSILNLVKEVNKTNVAFDRHPGKQLLPEDKVHYLNGLALLANIDDNISSEEREYLKELISAFDIEKEKLDEFIAFAENPNRKEVLLIKEAFEDSEIKYVFMVDAIFIAYADKEMHEQEKNLLNQYFDMFDISDKERKQLLQIHTKVKTAKDVYNLFNNDKIKQELFNYLLDYKQKKEDIDMFIVLKEKELLFFRKQPDNKWNRWHFGGEKSFAMKYVDVEKSIKEFKETLLDKLNLTYFENYSVKVLYSQYNKMDLKVLLDYFFDENCKDLSIMPLEKFEKENSEFDEDTLYIAFPQNEVKRPISKKNPPKEELKQKKYRFETILDTQTLKKIPSSTKGIVSSIDRQIKITVNNSVEIMPYTYSKDGAKKASELFVLGQEVDIIRENDQVWVSVIQ